MSEKRIYHEEEEYYPEDQLPEEARGWCRYHVATIFEHHDNEIVEYGLWKTGTHSFFVRGE